MNIGIIGLGLMGASIAKTIKKRNAFYEIFVKFRRYYFALFVRWFAFPVLAAFRAFYFLSNVRNFKYIAFECKFAVIHFIHPRFNVHKWRLYRRF